MRTQRNLGPKISTGPKKRIRAILSRRNVRKKELGKKKYLGKKNIWGTHPFETNALFFLIVCNILNASAQRLMNTKAKSSREIASLMRERLECLLGRYAPCGGKNNIYLFTSPFGACFVKLCCFSDVVKFLYSESRERESDRRQYSCGNEAYTIVDRIYWDNYEKRYFFGSRKQLKTLFKRAYGEVEDNIIIYIQRLKT